MQENEEFWDETGGDKLFTEFLTTDEQATTDAANEYKENRRRIQSELTTNWEEQVVWWIVNDA